MARDEYPGRFLTRGEAVYRIVEAFDLGHTKEPFLGACLKQPHECFFVFSAMSDFDDIAFEPFLKLYPDVNEKYRYYEAINVASMLGLIHGYLEEDATPFKPEVAMTRVQALKIVLGSADLVAWKDHFELGDEELQSGAPYLDPVLSAPGSWWYYRYISFAYEHGIIPHDDLFRPDEPVTFAELQEMINNTLAYTETRFYDSKAVAQRS